MKTLVCNSPRHLDYESSTTPDVTKDHAILKIRRIGICGTDLHAFEGTQPFFTYPRRLGHELAAELVEADGAPGFKKGDMVTLIPYFYCGSCVACRVGKSNCCVNMKVCGVHVDGGMAEYLSVPSYALVHSQGLNADSLALVEPLAIGAHAIRRAEIIPGEYVVVVGAGPIGLGTMEFARVAGAKVIALDVNPARLEFCREKLRVRHTIDGSASDVIENLKEITNGDMPSVVIDATGSLAAINNAFQFMSHGGRYVLVGLQKETISFSHPEFHKREGSLMSSRNATREDFNHVVSCLKNGRIDSGVFITHRVKFDQVKNEFESWLDPASRTIKVMVEME